MSAAASYPAIRILRPMPRRRKAPVEEGGQHGEQQEPLLDLDSTDPIILSNEFDRTQSVQDLKNQLEKGGFMDIEMMPITLENIESVADQLEQEMKEKRELGQEMVVFQLCDGTAFYIISTSKPVLKCKLQAAHVPTSAFQEFVTPPTMTDLQNIIKEIGFPMIVKPSISYASINISMKSVVHTPEKLLEQIHVSLTAAISSNKAAAENVEEQQPLLRQQQQCEEKKKEIDIETPTVFVERFLAGREFTALVVGDKDWGVRVYPVAERTFDAKLGTYERLLAFDQYWDGYTLEGGDGKDDDFCKYEMAKQEWQKELMEVAKNAYLALGGSGYGRVDIRTTEMDKCNPVVLEVNANCGLSFEKDSSSLANILIMSKTSPPRFVHDLVDHALQRNIRLHGSHYHEHRTSRSTGNVFCSSQGQTEVLVNS
ncbi:hypothetical protein EDD11_001086 [Mortierella claussenii]|nr:hypothetical protein EDD11_001086 [Mortierella claussenii]